MAGTTGPVVAVTFGGPLPRGPCRCDRPGRERVGPGCVDRRSTIRTRIDEKGFPGPQGVGDEVRWPCLVDSVRRLSSVGTHVRVNGCRVCLWGLVGGVTGRTVRVPS